MPRFSIKDLMLATTLVAVGFAVEYALFSYDPPPNVDVGPRLDRLAMVLVIFGAGAAMIGAGLFAPFHRKATGAGTGFLIAVAFVVIEIFVNF